MIAFVLAIWSNRWAATGILAALALAFGGMQTLRLAHLQADVAKHQAADAQAGLQREQAARLEQEQLSTKARKATDAYMADISTSRARAADIDDRYQRLLDALRGSAPGADQDPATACRTAAERARVFQGLLGQCAGLLRAGAARIGVLDPKVSGLQDQLAVGIDAVKPEDPPPH